MYAITLCVLMICNDFIMTGIMILTIPESLILVAILLIPYSSYS